MLVNNNNNNNNKQSQYHLFTHISLTLFLFLPLDMLVYIKEKAHMIYHVKASLIPQYLHKKYALKKYKEKMRKRTIKEAKYCK